MASSRDICLGGRGRQYHFNDEVRDSEIRDRKRPRKKKKTEEKGRSPSAYSDNGIRISRALIAIIIRESSSIYRYLTGSNLISSMEICF